MKHLAIEFNDITCSYPNTDENDYHSLCSASSAGRWVHQNVYGSGFVSGIDGTIIEQSPVSSASGWVKSAILYEDGTGDASSDPASFQDELLGRAMPKVSVALAPKWRTKK